MFLQYFLMSIKRLTLEHLCILIKTPVIAINNLNGSSKYPASALKTRIDPEKLIEFKSYYLLHL